MLKSSILKRGSLAVAMSLGLVGGVVAPSHAGGTATSAPEERSSTPTNSSTLSKADIVRFRKDLGLPSSDAALGAAEVANVPRNQFGIPLTPSEVADLTRRTEIRAAAGPLFQDVNSRADTTSGIWIDQQHGGGFVVGALPSLSAADRAAITAKVPPGGTITFQPVTRSARELRTWSDKLFSQLNAQAGKGSLRHRLSTLGLQLQGWGVQTDNNEIIVNLDPLPSDLSDLQAAWDEAAAAGSAPPREMVRFQAGTVLKAESEPNETRQDSPGQLKAGLQLNMSIGGCTANLSGTDSSGAIYQLTAGHCGVTSNATTGDATANMYIGSTAGVIYGNGTDVDAQRVALSPGGLGSPYAWAQLGNCGGPCQPQIDTITRVAPEGEFGVSDWVCMGGITRNIVTCGTILNSDYNAEYEGMTHPHQYVANYGSGPGNSGALVGSGSTAVGLHVAGDGGSIGVFTPLARVAARLGLTIMTTQPGVVADWALVKSARSHQCMDVQWGSLNPEAQIWNWPCNWGGAQQWSFVPGYPAGWYNIHRFNPSNMCVDLNIGVNNGFGNGRKIQQYPCHTGDNQVWMLRHVPGANRLYFNIVSMRTDEGGCVDLDIAGGGGQGALIQQWECYGAGQTNQLWYLG